jgi:hypothetical protein
VSGCGYIWRAPRVPTPGAPEYQRIQRGARDIIIANPKSVPQECVLPKGHNGPHRSLTGVTAALEEEKS